jgi:hypothetical protein
VQLANRKLAIEKTVELANRKLAIEKMAQLANQKLAIKKAEVVEKHGYRDQDRCDTNRY